MTQQYDIAIIGGGPAGLAAGLYGARARRRTVLFEKGVIGGQIALTAVIENYPGIMEINGFDLAQQMQQQAEKWGLETEYSGVTSIEPAQHGQWTVKTEEDDFLVKAVILTVGADYDKLEIPGEERLTGYGVSWCATCDAAFFKDQVCAVVGGGDAAMDEGLFVTRYASKVYVIHRRDQLRASAVLQERAFAEPKIEFIWNTVVEEVEGDRAVERLRLRNVQTGEISHLDTSALFIFIGQHPNTGFLTDFPGLEFDPGGHLKVNEWMETGVPGIFGAGDARQNAARQVASSVGDGVTAAIRADHYISNAFRE